MPSALPDLQLDHRLIRGLPFSITLLRRQIAAGARTIGAATPLATFRRISFCYGGRSFFRSPKPFDQSREFAATRP